ncbi:hypothetical protein PGT21_013201 [Puccinia graminis f. sp. tritici]|uniref:Uncharacterized protein n=1 Tax=Puccinia graminis f. sp. tritici TaxID=56615 RepID=A0A5B0Q2T9_PUCGR|nr:hypothetical protein PGT21_013201 [Puccinia graminis f. sp. tritici]
MYCIRQRADLYGAGRQLSPWATDLDGAGSRLKVEELISSGNHRALSSVCTTGDTSSPEKTKTKKNRASMCSLPRKPGLPRMTSSSVIIDVSSIVVQSHSGSSLSTF